MRCGKLTICGLKTAQLDFLAIFFMKPARKWDQITVRKSRRVKFCRYTLSHNDLALKSHILRFSSKKSKN